MNIRSMMEQMNKLNATNQSSEAAIADFMLSMITGAKRPNQKAFLVTAIQAYALLLQEHNVKVVA